MIGPRETWRGLRHRAPRGRPLRGARAGLRVAVSLLAALGAPAAGQVVEELVLADGARGMLGENPQIAGGRVTWSRRGQPGDALGDRIECRDLRFGHGESLGLTSHPFGFGGTLLTGERFFRGGIPAFPHLSVWEIGPDCELGPERRLSEDRLSPVAANSEYLFVKSVERFDRIVLSHLLAMPLEDLQSPEPPRFLWFAIGQAPTISRTRAASDRFFVWEDSIWEEGRRYWQIHVLDLARGLYSEPRVIDTRLHPRVRSGQGVDLALHGSYLVYQGGFDRTQEYPWGLFFVDLARDEEPEPIALLEEPGEGGDAHTWPAVSEDFIVWTHMIGFFRREGWAMRIIDGRPSGEAIHLGSGVSWPEIERNIVVFNGGTPTADGAALPAIKAWELDMPWASDVGDADANGRVNVSDAVVIIRYLFAGGPRPRLRLADSDLDREITLFDALDVLHSLFPRGPRP